MYQQYQLYYAGKNDFVGHVVLLDHVFKLSSQLSNQLIMDILATDKYVANCSCVLSLYP